MSRRWRVRRPIRWGATVAALLLGCIWLLSLRFQLSRQRIIDESDRQEIIIGGGRIAYRAWPSSMTFLLEDGRVLEGWLPWYFGTPWEWEFWPRFTASGNFSVYSFPLWMPALLFGLPAAALWCNRRRIPPGHCRACGYDLTGNVSGRCPECGAATPAGPL